jgi:hypothetical protein
MNFLRHNKIQKLSSCLLLSVFIFINAVKTFHTHALNYAAQQENSNKDATAFKAYFFCAICDFQFSKDSDAEVAAISVATPVHVVASFHAYILPILNSFVSTSSVRGPPAFLS